MTNIYILYNGIKINIKIEDNLESDTLKAMITFK